MFGDSGLQNYDITRVLELSRTMCLWWVKMMMMMMMMKTKRKKKRTTMMTKGINRVLIIKTGQRVVTKRNSLEGMSWSFYDWGE